jgi:hypothetical protein
VSYPRYPDRVRKTTLNEQGRRVESEFFAENTRSMRSMGELLKARVFSSTQWAIDLRNRLTKFQGGGNSASAAAEDRGVSVGPGRPPEPHPDLDAEEGA